MVKLADRVKFTTSTVGTGTIAVGTAVEGYQTPADGGILNGDTVRYVIEDGAAWEIGTSTYTSGSTSMSRSVIESSLGTSSISLSGNAVVFLSVAAPDLQFAADMDQTMRTTATPTFAGMNLSTLTLDGAPITATGTEINILDGVTASTAELNILDGVTASTAEINLLDGATALGPTTPGTTTDGGVVLFDGTDGSALKDGGVADASINGNTLGRGVSDDYRSTTFGFEAHENGTSSAIRNTLIGGRAGYNLTTGTSNTAVGYGALAGANIAAFDDSLFNEAAVTGRNNTAVGSALARVTSGDGNVGVGAGAGAGISSGDNNTAVGFNAGVAAAGFPSTGGNNTFIGYQAGSFSSPFAWDNESNRIVLGNNSVTNAYVKVAWTVTSDERDKTDFATMPYGLDVVDAIDTFTFKFDNRSSYFVYDEDGNIIDTPTPDGTHKSERTFVGFKAQQVQAVLDAAGFPSDVVVDTEDPDNLKMKETALIPLLINAIKELKARVEALESA